MFRTRDTGGGPAAGAGRLSRTVVAVLCALVLAGWLGGPLRERTREGNRLFADGDYDGALRAYTDAQLEDPESPRLHFNIGAVQYRQDKHQDAVESFRHALRSEDVSLQRDAHYNMGNAYFRQDDLESAILSYRNALEIDPDFEDAKYNLEFAQRKLREREQQMQQQQQQQQQGEGEEAGQQEQDAGEDQQEQAGRMAEEDEAEQEPESEMPEEQAAEEETEPEQQEQQPASLEEALGQLTPEQAQAILDALANAEEDAQREQIENRQGGWVQPEKDW